MSQGESGTLSPRDFETLLEASRALTARVDLHDLLQAVTEMAARVVHAETGSLLLVDPDTGDLEFDVALGAASERVKAVRLKPGEGLAGWVAAQGAPLIANEAQTDARWTHRVDARTDFVTRQIVAVPLRHRDRLLGVIEGINKRGEGGFTPTDVRALEILAAQVAVALENARLFTRLRAEKDTLAAVFGGMSDGALVTDAQGRLTLLNPAGASLLGTEPEAAAGLSLPRLTSSFDPKPDWASALTGPHVVMDWSRTEGKTLILEARLERLADGGWVGVFRDVTEARREDRVKRNFLSFISHKLRTPLVSITGFAPLLLRDKSLTESQRKALTAIRDQGQRLSQLVERLLSFATIEGETLELGRRRMRVLTALEKVQGDMERELERRSAKIVLDDGLEGLPAINADPARFGEAMRNLIENAVKFDRHSTRTVRVYGRLEAGHVVISVEDEGPGIPAEEIPRLFRKFYQVEEEFTGQVEGLGLGLPLVKRIVEAHGGTLKVNSILGRGSIFTTRWPVAE